MTVRKFSILFFVFSIIAGIIGFFVGEWLLDTYYGVWPNLLLMGVYFGQLALFFGLLCLVAELISPVINGRSWRLEYSGMSWKVLVPATLGMLFVAGLVCQFLYSLNFSSSKPPDDIVLALDISDSMNESDPKRDSLRAAKELILNMKQTHRAAVVSFNHEAYLTQGMFPISDKNTLDAAVDQIDQLKPRGNTDIGNALNEAFIQIEENKQPGRKPMVILFSDGYSSIDLEAAVEPYQKNKIAINTIGMSKFDLGGAALLKKISSETGGTFYDVEDTTELSNVFEKIYLDNQDRLLTSERQGIFKNSLYLTILRVLLMTVIGALFGLALGIIFDNRYLAKSYTIVGVISGVIAGLVLEFGMQSALLPEFVYRAIVAILLTVVTGLGTVLIPVKEKLSSVGILSRGNRQELNPQGFAKRDEDLNKGF